MRPFKFFFLFAIAVFVFSFLAKLVIMALLVAAVMTSVFFVFRKLRDFFSTLNWDGKHDDYPFRGYKHQPAFAQSKTFVEPLFQQMERRSPQWESDFRTIKIH